ncbi:MAG: phosphatidylserine decarboxylase [Candidatus Heimdallarchaeota archaeon]|nr:phosphatidylserine decarboxylase [Candidatus Heimdallarchaeota archaeon]
MKIAEGSTKIVTIISSIMFVCTVAAILICTLLPTPIFWHFGILGVVLFCGFFIFWTFRDPLRDVIINPKGIIAPADGTLMDVKKMKEGFSCLILMSPFNVHMNRSPIDGVVKSITFQKGSYWPVYFSNYAKRNQRNIIIIENSELGITAEFTQVSGIYGRRTIAYPKEGDEVKQSELIGIIRFGSIISLKVTGLNNFKLIDPIPKHARAGLTVLATFDEESD